MRSSYHFRIYAISIHAAREGGDCLPWFCGLVIVISIHAAREGGDSPAASMVLMRAVFQSTPPVKAATPSVIRNRNVKRISIHAAREGGDYRKPFGKHSVTHFNPRRP